MGKNKKQKNAMGVLADKGVVARNKACTRIVEVSITAPQAEENQHPLELAVVIDRSGSMQGEKLHFAKQAAAHLLDLLTEQDRAAVVMYDNHIDIVSPSAAMTAEARDRAKAAIQRIASRGSTNLFEGWLQGCREIADPTDCGFFRRTLLLSDGLANQGVTDQDEAATHVRALAARNISTSCFGIGQQYNEHLMEAMANAGGGNFHYLEAMSAIPLAFEREFDELINATFSNAELSLQLPQGAVCTVSSGWPGVQSGDIFRASIGSLYGGRMLRFYFQIQFDGSAKEKEVRVPITLNAKSADGKAVTIEDALTFSIVSAAGMEEASEDKALLERFALVDMADRATEALRMARAGRRAEAVQYLGQSVQRHSASMPVENVEKYQFMSHEIRNGMDEFAFKRRHQEEYLNKKTRAGVQDFRLRKVNGHMLAEMGGQRVLVDSGIPVSLGRADEWLFMQRVQPLSHAYLGVDVDAVSALVGAPIDFIIGADILKRYCVQFDLPAGHIAFSTRPMLHSQHHFPLEELMGVPALTIDVRGTAQQAFLDTGAKLSYVTRELLTGLTPVGHEEDFYPGLGVFETDVYEVEVSLGDFSFTLRCGILPPLLEATLQVAGRQGIIGVDFFSRFQVELDFARGHISLMR